MHGRLATSDRGHNHEFPREGWSTSTTALKGMELAGLWPASGPTVTVHMAIWLGELCPNLPLPSAVAEEHVGHMVCREVAEQTLLEGGRGGGGGGSGTQKSKYLWTKIAQIHIPFCKFHCFPL